MSAFGYANLVVAAMGLLMLAGPCGCRTASLPAADLSGPGWCVLQGQAAWKPKKTGLELAGELFVAAHPDGRCFVQFTKTPFTLVVARREAEVWQIEFPSRGIRLAGRNQPPSRFPWLLLPALVKHDLLPEEWEFKHHADGGWRMEHRRTGESLQGFLGP